MDRLDWYVARSSGLVAWGLVVASMAWGILLATRVLGRRPRPSWLLSLHRFLGGLAVVFVGVHVVALVADSYVHFGVADVLVPLASSWHPAAVAFGIVSFYVLLAVEITSLLRQRLSNRAWRSVHLLSYALFAMSTVHLLTAGTDARAMLSTGVIAVLACVAIALGTAGWIGRSAPPEAPPAPRAAPARPARRASRPGARAASSTL